MRSLQPYALAAMVLSVASLVQAQEHRVRAGLGYSLLDFEDLTLPVGVTVDLSVGLGRGLAVVGEVGWARGASHQFGLRATTNTTDLAAGIRWNIGRRRLVPFGQMLLGVERDRTDIERFGADSRVSALLQPGGGVEIRLRKRQALVAEIDWRRVPERQDGTNARRVLVGLRFDLR